MMASFNCNYQNHVLFSFFQLIRAIVILTPLGNPYLKNKENTNGALVVLVK